MFFYTYYYSTKISKRQGGEEKKAANQHLARSKEILYNNKKQKQMAEGDFPKPDTKKGLKDRLIENKNAFIVFSIIAIGFTSFVIFSGGASTYMGFIGEQPATEEAEPAFVAVETPIETEAATTKEPAFIAPESTVVEEPAFVEPTPTPEPEPEIEEAPPSLSIAPAPTINSTNPTDGADNIEALPGTISVRLNESDLSFFPDRDAIITENGGSEDLSTAAMQFDQTLSTLTIPYSKLEEGKLYTATIPAATVKNGKTPLNQDIRISFATKAEKEKIRIFDAIADPEEFNPAFKESRISFEISDKARVDLFIEDEDGNIVVELIDDKVLDRGEHFEWWNGTEESDNSGEIVDSGEYEYRINARNPDTGELEDTERGTISAIYIAEIEDFEGPDIVEQRPEQSLPSQGDPLEDDARMALQNASSGSTAGTGPGVLIYLLLPLGTYVIFNKK